MKHWLSQIKLGEWYSNVQYNYRPRNDKERNLMHSCYEEGYNNGFSNGLAEGKPKWHDLRKNPNDLPKIEGAYWCCISGGNLFFNYDVVYFSNNEWEFDTIVIAWIELPHFAGGLNVRSC